MQFHVDNDSGTSISGWIVLENPSAIPRLLISTPDGRSIQLEANVMRPDIKDAGLHRTGMAGFRVDDDIFPGLSETNEVEIREAQSGILVFRRHQITRHLARKLFRYDFQAMPQTQMESLLTKHFTASYQAVEQHPFDTLFGIINNQFSNSIYISGHPIFNRYQQLLRDCKFLIITLLRDPLEEFAERLLFVRYASSEQRPAYLMNYMTGLRPLLGLAEKIDFSNDDSLRAAFKTLKDDEFEAISNPFVRSLACNAEERPQRKHISSALDNLSSMDLVGLRSRYGDFKSILHEILNVDILGDHQLTEVTNVPVIAAKLARIGAVKEMIALDLEVYSYARDAIMSALPTT